MRIFLLPLFIALVVNCIIDYIIYKQLQRNTHAAFRTIRGAHVALSVVLGVSVILLAVTPKTLFAGHESTLTISIFAYGCLLAAKLVYVLVSQILRLVLPRKLRQCGIGIGIAAALVVISQSAIATLATRYDIAVNHVTLYFPNLPDSFDGYRMAQFSDFHLNSFGNDTTFVHKAVTTINDLRPDVIFFTGDLASSTSSEVTCFVNTLSHLHAPDGVMSVLGNHDYSDYYPWTDMKAKAADRAQLIKYERDAGWDVLLNESRVIRHGNDSIIIIGVQNIARPPYHTYGNLGKSYNGLNDNNFKILLTHNPVHWRNEVLPKTNIDLTLSGHTHAMQMVISLFGKEFSPSAWLYKDWSGIYQQSQQYLYVNIGLGSIGAPARFGDAAKPEITIITLKKSK